MMFYETITNILGRFSIMQEKRKISNRVYKLKVQHEVVDGNETAIIFYGLNITVIKFNISYTGPECSTKYLVMCVDNICTNGKQEKLLTGYLCGPRPAFSVYHSFSIVVITVFDKTFLHDNSNVTILHQAMEAKSLQNYIYQASGINQMQSLSFKAHLQYSFEKTYPLIPANPVVQSKIIKYFIFQFLSYPAKVTEISFSTCGSISKSDNMADFFISMLNLNVCDKPAIFISHTMKMLMTIYLLLPKSDSGFEQLMVTFRQYEIKEEAHIFPDISKYINYLHTMVYSIVDPKQLKMYGRDIFLSLLSISANGNQYINMSLDVRGTNYPTDDCSVLGLVIYDGGNTHSDRIGPFCGAFGIDDLFLGRIMRVRD